MTEISRVLTGTRQATGSTASRQPVLVATHDPAVRGPLAAFLTEAGFVVTVCPDAEAAQAACRERVFPLILLDGRLPGADMLTLCRTLRSLPHGELSAVLVLTPHAKEADLAAFLDAGADDYLLTPVDSAVARARLEVATRQAGLRGAHARTGAALRRSEARFRSLVQNAADIISVIGADGAVRYQSPAIARVLGYAPEERLGANGLELIHPDDVEPARQVLAGLAGRPGESATTTIRARHKDGSWRWLETTATNLIADPNVGGMVINAHDVTERVAFEARLAHQACHDALTGLPNRTRFEDRLGAALADAAGGGTSVAVLFLDLDGFKAVNDSLGHAAGDRLLVAVGSRLASAVGPEATLARFGGDEFTVLLPDAPTAREAVQVAERLLDRLRAPFPLDGRALHVDASVGVALSTAALDRPGDLLRAADIALYGAKAAGRATARVFEPAMAEQVTARMDLEVELRHAVEREELRLYYQPEVDLASGEIVGAEALVRWQHPVRGLLGPGAFIGVAEESDLIVPIGAWVLTEACRQLRDWRRLGSAGKRLAVGVNLSARQLRQPDVVARITDSLRAVGLPPRQLKLEITERVVVADAETEAGVLRALRAAGIRLAIDDFGTGYSSLSYIRRWPVDTVKIDRSFLGGLDHDAGSRQLVGAMVALAHAVGLDVTAEGIETAGQLARLREMGAERGQGFLFTPPLPAADFGQLLARNRPYDVSDQPAASLPTVGRGRRPRPRAVSPGPPAA